MTVLLINLHVARNLDIHVVLDNLSAHMGPEVTDWLSLAALHPHQLVWLNIIERWLLTVAMDAAWSVADLRHRDLVVRR